MSKWSVCSEKLREIASERLVVKRGHFVFDFTADWQPLELSEIEEVVRGLVCELLV